MGAEILLSGRTFSAKEAFDMGLVNRISEDVVNESLEMAEEICKAAPLAVKSTLLALRRGQEATGLGWEESMIQDAQSQAETYNSKDLAEGVISLKEKRAPIFKGQWKHDRSLLDLKILHVAGIAHATMASLGGTFVGTSLEWQKGFLVIKISYKFNKYYIVLNNLKK